MKSAWNPGEWEGFDRDVGNTQKNWARHKVSPLECEQVFFNRPLATVDDEKHSQRETRFFSLGQTDAGRLLFISFTVRKRRIRVISARDIAAKKGVFIMKKVMPVFKTEDDEREFWAKHDSADYIDWSKAKPAIFPNLKPSTKTISLRLPESMIEGLKVLANKRDMPYQSLLKVFLSERIEKEFDSKKRVLA